MIIKEDSIYSIREIEGMEKGKPLSLQGVEVVVIESDRGRCIKHYGPGFGINRYTEQSVTVSWWHNGYFRKTTLEGQDVYLLEGVTSNKT